jgi:hypothetical protein
VDLASQDLPSAQIGQPASDFTKPRSLERFDIPEDTLDHSVG